MIKQHEEQLARHFGKWCGKWTAKGRSFDGSETRYHRVHCKSWHCQYCAPRRANAYAKGIAEAAQRHDLTRFVTLTLDPKLVPSRAVCGYAGCKGGCNHAKRESDGGESVKYLRDCFNKLRVYLGRKFGRGFRFIAVMEFHKSGIAHLHLLVNSYIEWAWLQNAWQAVGGGSHVRIERRKDQHRIAKYLAKDLCGRVAQYLVKDLSGDCPKKQRRVTCSRGIQLLKKLARNHRWLLMREPIKSVFSRRCAVATEIKFDQHALVKCFVVTTEAGRNLRHNSPGFGCWEAI